MYWITDGAFVFFGATPLKKFVQRASIPGAGISFKSIYIEKKCHAVGHAFKRKTIAKLILAKVINPLKVS